MQVAIYLAGNQKWVLEHMVYDGFSKDDSVYTSAHNLLAVLLAVFRIFLLVSSADASQLNN